VVLLFRIATANLKSFLEQKPKNAILFYYATLANVVIAAV